MYYLASPIELSLVGVVVFSASTVTALVVVSRWFPQHVVIACRITLVVLWMFGTYVAVYGGFVPEMSIEPLTTYPWLGVIREVGFVTAESMLLLFLICYRKHGPSIIGLLAATILFAILAMWDRPPTDMPGYMYANSNFLVITLLILLQGLGVSLLGLLGNTASAKSTA